MKKTLDLDGVDSAFAPKQVFEGHNGHILLELQKSYGDDPRFTLDNRFANDVDPLKLPEELRLKYVTKPTRDPEQEMMLKVLGEVAPATLRRMPQTASVQIARFDPTLHQATKVHKVEEPPDSQPPSKAESSEDKPRKKNKKKKKEVRHYVDKIDYRKKAPSRKVEAQVRVETSAFTKTAGSNFKLFG